MDNRALLEYIRATERIKRLPVRSDKPVGSIASTAEIISWMPVTINGDAKTFKPNVALKILLLIMLLPAWIVIIVYVIRNSIELNLSIAIAFAFAGYCVIIGLVILKVFFNKELNYRIKLSADGLAINKDFHRWQDIKETAILQLPIGKGGSRYLVIVFLDDSFEVRDLGNFSSLWYPFHLTLARYIECFKRLSQ